MYSYIVRVAAIRRLSKACSDTVLPTDTILILSDIDTGNYRSDVSRTPHSHTRGENREFYILFVLHVFVIRFRFEFKAVSGDVSIAVAAITYAV